MVSPAFAFAYSQWISLTLIFNRNTLLHLSVRYDAVITMRIRRLTETISDFACQRGCTVDDTGKEPAASSASILYTDRLVRSTNLPICSQRTSTLSMSYSHPNLIVA